MTLKADDIADRLRRKACDQAGYRVGLDGDEWYFVGREGDCWYGWATEYEAWAAAFRRLCDLGEVFRHKKGGIYRTLTTGKETEGGGDVVIYEHLAPHERGVWVRDLAEFNEPGRFERVSA